MPSHSNDVREEARYVESLADKALNSYGTENEQKLIQEVRELQRNPTLWADVKKQIASDNSTLNGLPSVEIDDNKLNPSIKYHVGIFQSRHSFSKGSVGPGSEYHKEGSDPNSSVKGGRLLIPEARR